MMDNPVILSACRTPIGKFRGTLSSVPVTELGAVTVRSAVERAGLAAGDVDEVIIGNVLSAGVGQAPARQAALRGGLPPTVAAVTVNKMCGSGLKAIMMAAQAIRAGDADVIVAGGMESMSQSPYVLPREGAKLGDRKLIDSMMHDGLVCSFSGKGMGVIADDLATSDAVGRSAQDHFASQSHARAVAAAERGDFDAEIVPVETAKLMVTRDEGPRPETSEQTLSALSPAFDPEGSVTAGNASMISDGGAAVLVASQSFANQQGLSPLASIVGYATSGTAPEDLFIAPVAAVQRVLDQCRLRLDEIDLVEINEAFAVQMLACLDRLELSQDRVNVNGGAIALGHPIGASGARVLTTLIHAMIARDKQRGLAALCLGGGNAVAMVIERV